MTSVAINTETDELQFTNEADADGSYACAECRSDAEYVRSHIRQLSNGTQSRVRAHFRLSNCACGSGDPSTSNNGGGGGGGGETDLHERRKLEAMHEATTRFDAGFFDTEVYIGDKRADAVVEFADPHEQYGKGLVIEYQHKNEGKDIEATEKHFARHEYTTVWLWEDQYSFPGVIPEIDLFGGRVYTPWPDAVPPTNEWRGTGNTAGHTLRGLLADLPTGYTTNERPIPRDYYDDFARDLLDAYWDRLFTQPLSERYIEEVAEAGDAAVPAELPVDYFDDKAQQLFGKQLWPTLFREWSGDYEYKRHTIQGLVADLPTTTKPQPTLIGKWHLSNLADVWNKRPWKDRFQPPQAESYRSEVIQSMNLPSAEIPVKLTNHLVGKIKRELREDGEYNPDHITRPRNPFNDIQCWRCGTYWYAEADGNDHTKCPQCGEPVDFRWNLNTGRIDNVPDYAES